MIKYTAYMPHPPIMLPEIGGPECQKIAATIQAQKEISEDILQLSSKTDLLVIISPHAPAGTDYFPIAISDHYYGSFAQFARPDVDGEFAGNINLSTNLVDYLKDRFKIAVAELSEIDHGVLVPLYELARQAVEIPILPIGICINDLKAHYALGYALAAWAEKEQKNIIFVGSGDMSHALKDSGPYAFNSAGPQFDQKIVEFIKAGKEDEFLEIDAGLQENAAECGFRSLLTIAGIKNYMNNFKGEVLSYQGPFGVGYLTARWKG